MNNSVNILELNVIAPLARNYLRCLNDWEISEQAFYDCEEHDECDANMAMDAAFEWFGIGFPVGMLELECRLWNAAVDESVRVRRQEVSPKDLWRWSADYREAVCIWRTSGEVLESLRRKFGRAYLA